eukprot:COSAG02_NODE_110_length_36062_cov_85.812106_16_plen_84_part_00
MCLGAWPRAHAVDRVACAACMCDCAQVKVCGGTVARKVQPTNLEVGLLAKGINQTGTAKTSSNAENDSLRTRLGNAHGEGLLS